jgi:putative ABC transport system ATP-binding protein
VHGTGATAVEALRGVDLQVAAGELVAVMGPSGSGKSTLLTLAGGLDTATSGEVLVEGVPLSGLDRAGLAQLRRRSVGYVFQELNLLPGADGGGERRAAAGARRRARPGRPAAGRCGRWTSWSSARWPAASRRPVRRRAAAGRHRPRPGGGAAAGAGRRADRALDSITGESVLALLRQRVDAGAAAVLVTHEARHAGWADRVVFLRDGRVVDEARAEVLA